YVCAWPAGDIAPRDLTLEDEHRVIAGMPVRRTHGPWIPLVVEADETGAHLDPLLKDGGKAPVGESELGNLDPRRVVEVFDTRTALHNFLPYYLYLTRRTHRHLWLPLPLTVPYLACFSHRRKVSRNRTAITESALFRHI